MMGHKTLTLTIGLLAGAFSGEAAAQAPLFNQTRDSEPSVASAQLKPGANSFAESQARALVESKGYSDVSSLMNGSDGIWRGTAVKNDRKVDVSVDFQGHVAAK